MTARSTRVTLALTALYLGGASGAWALEYGTVVSSTPVVAQVPVTQRQCVDEAAAAPAPTSGAGALLGAVIGAAVGHSFGGGTGRAAATGVGAVAGAAIGNTMEASRAPPVAGTVQRCSNVTQYEPRTVGYDVVYDYAGVRRSARLAQDPGPRIGLEVTVTPVGALPAGRAAAAAPPPVPARPGYRSPADWQTDDEESPPPSRRAAAPQPVLYTTPAPGSR